MNANKPYEFHMSDLFTLQHTDRLDGGGTFESLLYTMAEEMGFVTRFRGDFALDVARLRKKEAKQRLPVLGSGSLAGMVHTCLPFQRNPVRSSCLKNMSAKF